MNRFFTLNQVFLKDGRVNQESFQFINQEYYQAVHQNIINV